MRSARRSGFPSISSARTSSARYAWCGRSRVMVNSASPWSWHRMFFVENERARGDLFKSFDTITKRDKSRIKRRTIRKIQGGLQHEKPTKATETKQIDFHRPAKFGARERFGLLGAIHSY